MKNIVIPMAGLGSRFTKVGIDTPKPLIKIKGKLMIEWALSSIPIDKDDNLIFIIRNNHIKNFNLDSELKSIFGEDITIISLDAVTEGAACTVLLAKEYIDNEIPLIITDCDHFFKNQNYASMMGKEGLDGFIPVFKTIGTKWSFTKFGSDGVATEVAEKNPISQFANIGAYFFKKGSYFVSAAKDMIEKGLKVNGEYYISPVYQQLIESGYKIYVSQCEEVWGLGTPEDVEQFEKNYAS